MKWKLSISFEGTDYEGWQSQTSGKGVQDAIEKALGHLFSTTIPITSSSRTDAGVHAWGLIAHFEQPDHTERQTPQRLRLAINALLPADIRVREARPAKPTFHARFDAVSKEYRYYVWNHPVMNPLARQQAWHVPRQLNLQAMQDAASMLVGRKDFRAFTCNRGVELKDAVRTLYRCDVQKRGEKITFILEGSGFLYKMCRCIVGTLIQVGEGKICVEAIPGILEHRNRSLSGMSAPARGLILWRVRYGNRKR